MQINAQLSPKLLVLSAFIVMLIFSNILLEKADPSLKVLSYCTARICWHDFSTFFICFCEDL